VYAREFKSREVAQRRTEPARQLGSLWLQTESETRLRFTEWVSEWVEFNAPQLQYRSFCESETIGLSKSTALLWIIIQW